MYVELLSSIYTLQNPSVAWVSLNNKAQFYACALVTQQPENEDFLDVPWEGRFHIVGNSPSIASLAPKCWFVMADGHLT